MGWSNFRNALLPLMRQGPISSDEFATAIANQYDLVVKEFSSGERTANNPVVLGNKELFELALKTAFKQQSAAETHLGIFDLIADCFPIYWSGAQLAISNPSPIVPPGCVPPGTPISNLCTYNGGSPSSLKLPPNFGAGIGGFGGGGGGQGGNNPPVSGKPLSETKSTTGVSKGYFSRSSKNDATLVFCCGGTNVGGKDPNKDGRVSGDYMYDYLNKLGNDYHLYVTKDHLQNDVSDDYNRILNDFFINPKKKVLYLFSGGWRSGYYVLKKIGAQNFDRIYLVDIWMGPSKSVGEDTQRFYKNLARDYSDKVEYIYTSGAAGDETQRDRIVKSVKVSKLVTKTIPPSINAHMTTNVFAVDSLLAWDKQTNSSSEQPTNEQPDGNESNNDPTTSDITDIPTQPNPSLKIPFSYGKALSSEEYLNQIILRAYAHLFTISGTITVSAISSALGTPVISPIPWVGFNVAEAPSILTEQEVTFFEGLERERELRFAEEAGRITIEEGGGAGGAMTATREEFEKRASIPCPNEPLWDGRMQQMKADIKLYRASGCIWPSTGEYELKGDKGKLYKGNSIQRLGFTLIPTIAEGKQPSANTPSKGCFRWMYDYNSEYRKNWMTTITIIVGGKPTPLQVHRLFADRWPAVSQKLTEKNLLNAIRTCAGTWVPRNVSCHRPLTNHSWGMAIDINAGEYPFGSKMYVKGGKYIVEVADFSGKITKTREMTKDDRLHYEMGLVFQSEGFVWLAEGDCHHIGLYEAGKGLNAPDLDSQRYETYKTAYLARSNSQTGDT